MAEVLAEQLRLTPPDLFEEVDVIVNTWPTGRWLSEQVASVNGINALVNFPFPGTYLRKLAHDFLGSEFTRKDNPWSAEQLTWRIIESLPELLKKNQAAVLLNWLDNYSDQDLSITAEKWQLAKSISEAFDDYLLYRPELIGNWCRTNKASKDISKSLPADSQWQPLLFKLVKEKIIKEPFCMQVNEIINKLKLGEKSKKDLPAQFYIFGVNSLAPLQIELIQALSSTINIEIFLLTPCQDLWTRCKEKREKIEHNSYTKINKFWLLGKPRLEANLGRMGSEFEQLLEGSGEYQLGEWQERNLFAMPASISENESKLPTLLEQLQQKLVNKDSTIQLRKEDDDNSISFIECPGQKRQVQVIRDQIIQLFALNKSLQPKDILIMTPHVERFAPLIPSVFNDKSATGVTLPWTITDRSQQNEIGLIHYLNQLLDIACGKLTASNLDQLLTHEVIKNRYKLNTKEINNITFCLQEAGFRWGLDDIDKNGDEANSLTWCLERWLMGAIFPNESEVVLGGLAPFSKGISNEDLYKWWEVLSKISNQIKLLRNSKRCHEWVKLLKEIVNELSDHGDNWSWEYQNFYEKIDEWLKNVGDFEFNIETEVIADILKSLIFTETGRFGHRSGKITISALEPMRAIPHKVIVLMGLDEGIFPRQNYRPGFNLLEQKRLLGDPKSTDKDRYVLIEALMSARHNLLITWNSRDEKTGELLPPSNPVQQWLEYLEGELGETKSKEILKNPDPNPLDKRNFISQGNFPPFSCDKRNLQARKEIDKITKVNSVALAFPLKWNSHKASENITLTHEQLLSWLTRPQATWLKQYGIYPRELEAPIQDQDPLSLSELTRYKLLNENFRDLIKNSMSDKLQLSGKELKIDWVGKYKGQGILPPKSAALIEEELLNSRWQNLLCTISRLGELNKKQICYRNEVKEYLIAGEKSILIEVGRLKAKNIIEGWLNHLKLCSSIKKPTKTIIIAKSISKLKNNNYQISIEFAPIPSNKANDFLIELEKNAYNGLSECWPVPPNSGWELALARHKNSDQADVIFKRNWEGAYNFKGERNAPEMQVCFGYDSEAETFLKNKSFNQCLKILYRPLLENLLY
ncbi:Exodeoxyribonuclease V gamma chain [Prochlorococcus sp. MIT 0601]|nr:Exodeoxyribonuclease V gamma chain [Prochlorococcus sp. MIT 0601]